MEINKEVRKKQLQSLNEYIGSSKDKVQSLLNRLGWSVDKLLEKDERIDCSIDPSHRIDRKTADKHLAKCEIKSQGYDLDEQLFLSEPLIDDNYPGRSLVLDQQKKIEIFTQAVSANPYFMQAWNGLDPDPKTSDRFFATFSPDERLALYDYCRKNSVGPKRPDEYIVPQDINTEENKVFSLNELRAFERDAKRRQVKYKSVHTDRKTYTEVMKEVIEKQMELYNEWMNQNKDTDNDYEEHEQKQTDPVDLEECKSHDHPAGNNYSNGEQIEQGTRSERKCESPGKYSNTSSNRSGRRERDKADRYRSSHSHSRSHSRSRHSSLESYRSGNNKVRSCYKEEPQYERYYDYKYKDREGKYGGHGNKRQSEDYSKRDDGKHRQKIKSRIEVKGGGRNSVRHRSDYDYERNRSKDR